MINMGVHPICRLTVSFRSDQTFKLLPVSRLEVIHCFIPEGRDLFALPNLRLIHCSFRLWDTVDARPRWVASQQLRTKRHLLIPLFGRSMPFEDVLEVLPPP